MLVLLSFSNDIFYTQLFAFYNLFLDFRPFITDNIFGMLLAT
jgi:hypothetical protein